jgi:hypothetical protein
MAALLMTDLPRRSSASAKPASANRETDFEVEQVSAISSWSSEDNA